MSRPKPRSRPKPQPKPGAARKRKGGFPWGKSVLAVLLIGGFVQWVRSGFHGPWMPKPAPAPAGVRVAADLPATPATPASLPPPNPTTPRPSGTNRPATASPTAAPALPEPADAGPRIQVSNRRLRRNEPPAPSPEPFQKRPATNLLEAQVVLASFGISSGSIDGQGGAQTAAALKAFQMWKGLEPTGWLDRATREALPLSAPPLAEAEITADDLEGLAPVPSTWLGKSQAAFLDHESLLERLAEESQSSPALLRRLNPEVDWEHPVVGTRVRRPRVGLVPARRPALVRVSLAGRHLRVFDERGDLLAHFPCSIAKKVEKRPVGDLHVVVAVADPDYTFDPDVFPESAEAKALGRKLRLPPGPNNPVGVAWIGLDRPGYGIHGTPRPEEVGRTESHGCFRLANWNADLLRRMAWVGLTVRVEP